MFDSNFYFILKLKAFSGHFCFFDSCMKSISRTYFDPEIKTLPLDHRYGTLTLFFPYLMMKFLLLSIHF